MKRLKVANFILSIFLTLGLLLVLTVATVRAVPLNLTLGDFPQIATSSIAVNAMAKKDKEPKEIKEPKKPVVAAPEPGSLILMLTGLAALFGLRKWSRST